MRICFFASSYTQDMCMVVVVVVSFFVFPIWIFQNVQSLYINNISRRFYTKFGAFLNFFAFTVTFFWCVVV